MVRVKQGNGGPVQFRHRMEGLTTLVDGHRHAFGNLTDLFIREDGRHKHTFSGITTTAEGHRHNYSGQTGLNIGFGPNHFHPSVLKRPSRTDTATSFPAELRDLFVLEACSVTD